MTVLEIGTLFIGVAILASSCIAGRCTAKS